MSSKQTRKSVSVSGVLYQALKNYCNVHGRTSSDLVETEMRRFLKLPPRASSEPAKAEKKKPEKKPKVSAAKKSAPPKAQPSQKKPEGGGSMKHGNGSKNGSNGAKNGNGHAELDAATAEVLAERAAKAKATKVDVVPPPDASVSPSSSFDANGRAINGSAPPASRPPGNVWNF